MRTSFLRTHLDIWIPLPTFRHTETFCHLLTCCPHSPPGLKIRTCTNVTPVTHLQTQTSKFEIYSLTTCFSDIARGKEGSSTCLLTSPDSCSKICNFSAFGHKTWNAICPTTCLEMDLFQFSCEICGDVFSGFANQCPTICRGDFHSNITVNNRGSAELLHVYAVN